VTRLRIFLVNVGLRQPFYPLVAPPLGILCLAAYLRSKLAADIRLINQRLNNDPNEWIVRQIVDFDSDVVGLSSMTTGGYLLRDLTQKIRDALPGTLIVLGGPHASAAEGKLLEESPADVVVPGEGERSFEDVIRTRFDGGTLADVPGIFWRDEDNQIILNQGPVRRITDLDCLPPPAYDLIDLPDYWRRQSILPIPRRPPYLSLFSSRGCPYHCNFCHHIFGKKYVGQSAEHIVDEIEFFSRQYDLKEIEFFDDVFNLDKERLFEFSDLVQKRGLRLKIAFPNGLRVDILTEEAIDSLVRAGMYYSICPLESGSSRIQELMGKRLNIPRFLDNVELMAKRGVFINGCAILGFPTETEEELRLTVDTLCESQAHTGLLFTATPFPNTDLYRTAEKIRPEALKQLRYDGMDLSGLFVNLSDVPDHVLLRYQRMGNLKFFMNPKRIVRLLRAYPRPHLLPLYLPIYLRKVTKGLMSRKVCT